MPVLFAVFAGALASLPPAGVHGSPVGWYEANVAGVIILPPAGGQGATASRGGAGAVGVTTLPPTGVHVSLAADEPAALGVIGGIPGGQTS